jgi:hypothetical protein
MRIDRHLEEEASAHARGARYPHAAAAQLNQPLAEGEAQARAAPLL